jgi:hypothetical protein
LHCEATNNWAMVVVALMQFCLAEDQNNLQGSPFYKLSFRMVLLSNIKYFRSLFHMIVTSVF